MYVDSKNCRLCSDGRAVESGQLVIHFRDLTSVDPRAMEVRVTHSEHRRKVLASQAVLHDSFPVVGYVVVTLGADEDIEVVFVFNGKLITPRQYELAEHSHDDEVMSTVQFSAFRIRVGE